MADPVTLPVVAPSAAVVPAPTTPACPAKAPHQPESAPTPAAGDTAPTTPSAPKGAIPATSADHGVDWGRMGIAAGLAPVGYAAGIYEHELGGHGLMALALGAHDVSIDPLPHTYTRTDGSTGLRFAEMSYQYGPGWTPGKTAAVDLAPSMLDTAIMGTTTTLYETGHWPSNPWASGALFVWHAAAVVDLANAAQGALIHPDNLNADTAHAANIMGVNPRVLGGVEAGLAVAGTVEAVRIGMDIFSKHPAKEEPPKGVSAHLVVSPTSIGVAGTF